MTTNSYRPNLNNLLPGARVTRSLAFGVIIVTALMAFEIFNYSTTDYALADLLGNLEFAGLRWSTILAIAFCGIDFAGIARLFAPELGEKHNENWFLFGAWLLAATMNAMLTWWGVSLAILGHQAAGEAVITRATLLRVAPVFVAVLVWLIRVLIIGAFSIAGDRLFNTTATAANVHPRRRPLSQPERNDAERAPSQTQAARPRPLSPLQSGEAISNRIPGSRSPAAAPRYSSSLIEPDYVDDEDNRYSEQPSYGRAPLAARSGSRPTDPSKPISEGPTSRTPIPRRRS